jgi:DNA modification methylase
VTLVTVKNKSRHRLQDKKKRYLDKLTELLKEDLDFHNLNSTYASHNFHSFPAKFPPQLPKKFILNLTSERDVVLDPMVGSGTTVIEGLFNNRKTIGFDIDPLAIMISKVKATSYNKIELVNTFNVILNQTIKLATGESHKLQKLYNRFDAETKKFIEYWFYKDTIQELLSLSYCISNIGKEEIRLFFRVLFSSIIITKMGGVSLALDLAHTRPHKAKKIYNVNSELIFQSRDYNGNSRHLLLEKKLKSPIAEFKKKFFQNIENTIREKFLYAPLIEYADSQSLPLPDNSVDLIITSPPYASNAIDYMRAHKFSLVWFDYKISGLKERRAKFIGSDSVSKYAFECMPPFTNSIIKKVCKNDEKKSLVLQRYYSEITKVLREMYRVLKPGKAAIVVVGNSTIGNIISETALCLKEIGQNIGFQVPHIGIRNIDRNRRMLPASYKKQSSGILKRMNEEYIIGFYKG